MRKRYRFITERVKVPFIYFPIINKIAHVLKLLGCLSSKDTENLSGLYYSAKYSVFNQSYPVADEKAMVRDEVELAVQVNSKLRARIVVATSAEKADIEAAALEAVKDQLAGAPKKIIIVPGRLVNIIA